MKHAVVHLFLALTIATALFAAISLTRTLANEPPLQLAWNYPTSQLSKVYFEVWSTTNLSKPFSLYAKVTNATVLVIQPDGVQFFRCRAVDKQTGDVSPWNVQ